MTVGSALIALAVIVIGATWKLALGGRIIARGDLLLYFYPLRDFAAQAIREWRIPLWNPYTFMGAPFLANSQVGFFYPPNVLMAWLPTERAVSLSITLHLLIAAFGMFALAQRGMGLRASAAFVSAVAFALGGYLGAQIEHLNQLQVLSWLPLQVLIVLRFDTLNIRKLAASIAALALLIALQVLAGHTQSLYICMVTLGIVVITHNAHRAAPLTFARRQIPLIYVALAGALAALICAAQLLPTYELSQASARAGGLAFNEVGSFSWRPWVIGRALLPTYGDPLFAEYVAYLGAGGMALALLGAINGVGAGGRRVALVLCVAGIVLALGVVTPLFNVLYRVLPGFNLFRAQARWLILFALGTSMLIGLGAQHIADGVNRAARRRWLVAWLVTSLVIAVAVWLGARFSPEAEYRALPESRVMLGWLIAWGVATLCIVAPRVSLLLPIACIVELLVASQFQPYARAADAQALTSLRPATAHLLNENLSEGRVLSLSALTFDPGDRAEQSLIYTTTLSADELYDRIIASKYKEILSPNLALYYRLPSVDGYDGGLLPTRAFNQFVARATTLTNSDKRVASDGRLREFLSDMPSEQFLRESATRYIIADKTQDIFVEDVYYDTLLHARAGDNIALPLTPYRATALGVLLRAPSEITATVAFEDGTTQTFVQQARAHTAANTGLQYGYARLEFDSPKPATQLTISARVDVIGLSSIDARDRTFVSQPVWGEHRFKMVYSGDVKIYENQNVTSRVSWRDATSQSARITDVSPEHVRVQLDAPLSAANQMILRDACYAGWQASIDGQPAAVTCSDGIFRAVDVPAGARVIDFEFRSASFEWGIRLSALGVLIWLALLIAARFIRKK